MPQSANERPFTEIHHNNKSLILCFLDDDQKQRSADSAKLNFPEGKRSYFAMRGCHMRRSGHIPIPSNQATKYYCIKGSRIKIKTRYPCYDPSLLHIPPEANSRLQRSQRFMLPSRKGTHGILPRETRRVPPSPCGCCCSIKKQKGYVHSIRD